MISEGEEKENLRNNLSRLANSGKPVSADDVWNALSDKQKKTYGVTADGQAAVGAKNSALNDYRAGEASLVNRPASGDFNAVNESTKNNFRNPENPNEKTRSQRELENLERERNLDITRGLDKFLPDHLATGGNAGDIRPEWDKLTTAQQLGYGYDDSKHSGKIADAQAKVKAEDKSGAAENYKAARQNWTSTGSKDRDYYKYFAEKALKDEGVNRPPKGDYAGQAKYDKDVEDKAMFLAYNDRRKEVESGSSLSTNNEGRNKEYFSSLNPESRRSFEKVAARRLRTNPNLTADQKELIKPGQRADEFEKNFDEFKGSLSQTQKDLLTKNAAKLAYDNSAIERTLSQKDLNLNSNQKSKLDAGHRSGNYSDFRGSLDDDQKTSLSRLEGDMRDDKVSAHANSVTARTNSMIGEEAKINDEESKYTPFGTILKEGLFGSDDEIKDLRKESDEKDFKKLSDDKKDEYAVAGSLGKKSSYSDLSEKEKEGAVKAYSDDVNGAFKGKDRDETPGTFEFGKKAKETYDKLENSANGFRLERDNLKGEQKVVGADGTTFSIADSGKVYVADDRNGAGERLASNAEKAALGRWISEVSKQEDFSNFSIERDNATGKDLFTSKNGDVYKKSASSYLKRSGDEWVTPTDTEETELKSWRDKYDSQSTRGDSTNLDPNNAANRVFNSKGKGSIQSQLNEINHRVNGGLDPDSDEIRGLKKHVGERILGNMSFSEANEFGYNVSNTSDINDRAAIRAADNFLSLEAGRSNATDKFFAESMHVAYGYDLNRVGMLDPKSRECKEEKRRLGESIESELKGDYIKAFGGDPTGLPNDNKKAYIDIAEHFMSEIKRRGY